MVTEASKTVSVEASTYLGFGGAGASAGAAGAGTGAAPKVGDNGLEAPEVPAFTELVNIGFG